MRAALRRLERLEAAARLQCTEPETVIFIPHNGRDDRAPGYYRQGPATVVLYEPGGDYDPNSAKPGPASPPAADRY